MLNFVPPFGITGVKPLGDSEIGILFFGVVSPMNLWEFFWFLYQSICVGDLKTFSKPIRKIFGWEVGPNFCKVESP